MVPQVRKERRRVAYDVGEDEDGAAVLRCGNVEGGLLYPEEVPPLGDALLPAHLSASAHPSTHLPAACAPSPPPPCYATHRNTGCQRGDGISDAKRNPPCLSEVKCRHM